MQNNISDFTKLKNYEENDDENKKDLKEKFNQIMKEEKLKSKNLKVQSLIKEYEKNNTIKRNFHQKKPIFIEKK